MSEQQEIELITLIHDEMNFEHEPWSIIDRYLYDDYSKVNIKEVKDALLPLCKLLNKLFFDY